MTPPNVYEFGRFRLDPTERSLCCDGFPIVLTEKAFEVLLVLVDRSGHLVEKSELMNAVWGDTCIEESNLTVTISMLRKALHDDRSGNRLIETVVKRGYRFLPQVSKFSVEPPPGNDDKLAPSQSLDLNAVLVPSQGETIHSRSGYIRWTSLLLALLLVGVTSEQLYLHLVASRTQSQAGNAPIAAPLGAAASGATQLNSNQEFVARQLYTEGRFFSNKRTEAGFRRSIECFQQAISKDPNYAEAYAGLAESYTLLSSYTIEPQAEGYPNAKSAAVKALQLNGSLPEGHTSLGLIALYYEWNWDLADREFRKAIDLNPEYSGAYTWDSLYFAVTGNTSESLRRALTAQQLDPLSMAAAMHLGSAYYWDRQLDKAAATYRHLIMLDPNFARAHSRLGIVLAAQQDYSGAIRESHKAMQLSGPDSYTDGVIGYAEARNGNMKVARRTLDVLEERSHHEHVPAFSRALIYIGLGDRNKAIDWLERAQQDRSIYLVYAKVDPLLDPLRANQRFQAILTNMGVTGNAPNDKNVINASNPAPKNSILESWNSLVM